MSQQHREGAEESNGIESPDAVRLRHMGAGHGVSCLSRIHASWQRQVGIKPRMSVVSFFVQIRASADEWNKHDKKSAEYRELQKKLQPLMEKFKATAPKK